MTSKPGPFACCARDRRHWSRGAQSLQTAMIILNWGRAVAMVSPSAMWFWKREQPETYPSGWLSQNGTLREPRLASQRVWDLSASVNAQVGIRARQVYGLISPEGTSRLPFEANMQITSERFFRRRIRQIHRSRDRL